MALDVKLEEVQLLQWPQDKDTLAQLSLIEFQCWYAGQNAQYMVWLGQDTEFKKWIFWHYTLPMKCKRLYYKLKKAVKGWQRA